MRQGLKFERCCRRKRKYTKEQAFAVAKRRNREGEYLKPYKCQHCDGWHVGKPFGKTMVDMAFDRLRLYNQKHAIGG